MHELCPSVLIVDTNYAVIPLIDSLQNKGCEVTVVGSYCGKSVTDRGVRYKKLDYQNAEKLREFILDENFDYVVPGCTDQSYLQCSKLGIAGCETLEIIEVLHNKKKLKDALLEFKINVAEELKASADRSRPYIVKPVDAYSGRGVTILNPHYSLMEMNSALNIAKQESKTGKAIVEEFITGELYSVSLYWTGEAITNFVVIREECLSNQFRVDISYVKATDDNSVDEAELKNEIEKFAVGMRLRRGIIHFQLISRGGRSYFLECMRRLPGDLYSRLVEISSGWKYHCSYLAPFVNGLVKDKNGVERTGNSFIRVSVSSIGKDRRIESLIKNHGVKYEKYSQNRNSKFIRSTYMIPVNRQSALGVGIGDILRT